MKGGVFILRTVCENLPELWSSLASGKSKNKPKIGLWFPLCLLLCGNSSPPVGLCPSRILCLKPQHSWATPTPGSTPSPSSPLRFHQSICTALVIINYTSPSWRVFSFQTWNLKSTVSYLKRMNPSSPPSSFSSFSFCFLTTDETKIAY